MFEFKEDNMRARTLVWGLVGAAAIAATGCGEYGKVEQGRVITYNKQSHQVTLILDSTAGQAAKPAYDALPPVVVKSPEDPDEMGPVPQAGKLLRVELTNREIVVFDAAANQLRSIHYTPLEERHNVARGAGLPAIDKAKQTITVYWAPEKTAVMFS